MTTLVGNSQNVLKRFQKEKKEEEVTSINFHAISKKCAQFSTCSLIIETQKQKIYGSIKAIMFQNSCFFSFGGSQSSYQVFQEKISARILLAVCIPAINLEVKYCRLQFRIISKLIGAITIFQKENEQPNQNYRGWTSK